MDWLLYLWHVFSGWWPALVIFAEIVLTVGTMLWIVMTKSNPTSAVAWCLLIFFLPFIGPLCFLLAGYQHVERPIRRKRRHKLAFGNVPVPQRYLDAASMPFGKSNEEGDAWSRNIARLALRFGAYPVTRGNHLDFYFAGMEAFDAMIEAMQNARHHIHLEFFIFEPDDLGRKFLDLLALKAKEGVQVRLLYDAMGSYHLPARLLQPLHDAGGESSVFLPLNLLRRRYQVNLRNHRKILVVDGEVGFIGGLNIGDEYVGKVPQFPYWRDTHLRIRGPGVVDLQRVFCEDWDFASNENVLAKNAHDYLRVVDDGGPYCVQIIDSGPDRDVKSIREISFAAFTKATKRVWIASPYLAPDDALLNALRQAAYGGLDVRLLCQFQPDHCIPQYAARYYWTSLIEAGVKIYQYARGMMHAKVYLIDDAWGSVGTANLDNRSMFLNFEVNCLIYSAEGAKLLEAAFERDFADSILLNPDTFANRPFAGRVLENACRLLSPIL